MTTDDASPLSRRAFSLSHMTRVFESLRSAFADRENMDFWVHRLPAGASYAALRDDLGVFRSRVAEAVLGIYQESRAADPARAERESKASARNPEGGDPMKHITALCESIESGEVEAVPAAQTEEALFNRIYAVDEDNFISREALQSACRAALAEQPGAVLRKVHTSDVAWRCFDCSPPYVLCALDDAAEDACVFIYELHD